VDSSVGRLALLLAGWLAACADGDGEGFAPVYLEDSHSELPG
jgi:hypothetical protein